MPTPQTRRYQVPLRVLRIGPLYRISATLEPSNGRFLPRVAMVDPPPMVFTSPGSPAHAVKLASIGTFPCRNHRSSRVGTQRRATVSGASAARHPRQNGHQFRATHLWMPLDELEDGPVFHPLRYQCEGKLQCPTFSFGSAWLKAIVLALISASRRQPSPFSC